MFLSTEINKQFFFHILDKLGVSSHIFMNKLALRRWYSKSHSGHSHFPMTLFPGTHFKLCLPENPGQLHFLKILS